MLRLCFRFPIPPAAFSRFKPTSRFVQTLLPRRSFSHVHSHSLFLSFALMSDRNCQPGANDTYNIHTLTRVHRRGSRSATTVVVVVLMVLVVVVVVTAVVLVVVFVIIVVVVVVVIVVATAPARSSLLIAYRFFPYRLPPPSLSSSFSQDCPCSFLTCLHLHSPLLMSLPTQEACPARRARALHVHTYRREVGWRRHSIMVSYAPSSHGSCHFFLQEGGNC